MNKKTLKSLAITAAVLVLLIAGYLLLAVLPEAEDPVNSASPAPTVAGTDTNYLIKENYYDLKSMAFDFKEGTDFTIHLDSSADTIRFELEPASAGWTYDQDKMRATAFNMISVVALAEVASDVKDFTAFGLDAPALVAKATLDLNGKEVVRELHVGNLTTMKDSYYARMAGETTVFAVSKLSIDPLLKNEMLYRAMDFYPSYLGKDGTTVQAEQDITYIRVLNPVDGSDIELTARTEEETKKASLGASHFYMTKPVQSEGNDNAIVEELINIAAALQVVGVVEDDPKDLAQYGLDQPLEIWMKNIDGQQIHYLIGDSGTNGVYVLVEGTNSVLFAVNFNERLRQLNFIDYMFKLLWLHSISDVKSLAMDLDGEKHLLEIHENRKDAEGKEIFDATLDGKPIEATNAKRLYARALNMLVVDDITPPMQVAGKTASYTLTIYKTDGRMTELKLYALNERQYAASLDGADAAYFINVSDIRNLLAAFDYINAGQEIPR